MIIGRAVALSTVWGTKVGPGTRKFCGLGLKNVYGLTFKQYVPLDFDGPLTKGALKKGDVEVGLLGRKEPVVGSDPGGR